MLGLSNDLDKKSNTSFIAIGWHFVFNHLGVIIRGSLLTKSLIISNDALPDPTIMPALSAVIA
jgi:hypothetical protein